MRDPLSLLEAEICNDTLCHLKRKKSCTANDECKRSNLNIYWTQTVGEKNRTDGKSELSLKLLTPEYVKTIQLPAMNWGDVLAKIGGLLGLLIGASVISFFELIEFVLISIYMKSCGSTVPANRDASLVSLVETKNEDNDDEK